MPAIVPSDYAGTVRVLLDLADDPRHDVVSTSEYTSPAVIVPDYLYERWKNYLSLEASPPVVPKKSGSKKL
jgi:hypothetical protein